MSKLLTPSIYSNKGLENNWINLTWNAHDMICGCNNCWKHLADILKRQGNQQLCLPSTSTEDAGVQTGDGDGEDVLEPGDLDALFADDFGDDTG